jgi:hypothetical protein
MTCHHPTHTRGQAIEEYIQYYYGHIFRPGALQTVSVHLRLGYDHEPSMQMLEERGLPPHSFYEEAFESFDRKNVVFLIFSDNLERSRQMLAPMQRYQYKLLFIDENVVMSIRLMALCNHHILTSSTLSFWGAYLDPRQPHGGRTILHEAFFKAHGRGMIPYAEWEVLGTPALRHPRH